jgi:hypothetical protein
VEVEAPPVLKRLVWPSLLAMMPTAAFAHGPIELGVLVLWDAILLVLMLMFLAFGPRPFRRRLITCSVAIAAIVAAFFVMAAAGSSDVAGAVLLLTAAAPVVAFVLVFMYLRAPATTTWSGWR